MVINFPNQKSRLANAYGNFRSLQTLKLVANALLDGCIREIEQRIDVEAHNTNTPKCNPLYDSHLRSGRAIFSEITVSISPPGKGRGGSVEAGMTSHRS